MARPESPLKASTFSTSSQPNDLPASAAARQRLPKRQSSLASISASPKPGLDRRRSSLLSFSSLEDATHSVAEDIINPRTSKADARSENEENEVTNWHSTPLAFAILPAVGGLFFENGSAFITDFLIVGLAAIFMNWSIRLPWDWYYSAQVQKREFESDRAPGYEMMDEDEDEPEGEEEAVADSRPSTAKEETKDDDTAGDSADDMRGETPSPRYEQRREKAAAELRRQEVLALMATFIFPVLAAYLLHVMRAQLSKPSTTLVADYNLSIFLLAAEIRPCRQLVRLIMSRTLHLQRTVASPSDDPFAPNPDTRNATATLATRIADLETQLENHASSTTNVNVAQKADLDDVIAELKKRYEPRIEGLERAIRRYEKRSQTLALLTDQRLNGLDTHVKDTMTLAAAAAQQSREKSAVAVVSDLVVAVCAWPVKVGWAVVTYPLEVVEELYGKARVVLFGPGKMKKRGRSANGAAEEKGRGKSGGKRVVAGGTR